MIVLALRVRAERQVTPRASSCLASRSYLFLLFATLLVDRLSGGLSSLLALTIATSVSMTDMQKPEKVSGSRSNSSVRACSRSVAIALALGAFVVVIFLVTLVSSGATCCTRPCDES